MANRHLSRSIVLQSLFEWDLNAIERKAVIDVLDRNIEEFAPNKTDKPFMENSWMVFWVNNQKLI
ncbi:MAG: hypothetical protein R3B53_02160 [Candidatus Paceibacterota bacterium]